MQAHKLLIFMIFMAASLVLAPAGARSGDAAFSQAELDQMLAPVALYPDTVLSHVLIASTYPLEVIQAARWSRANPELSGEEAVAAVDHMDWDPSVMALVAFPELLARMDEDIEWTQRLGDAFLVQEEQVVDTVQRLRDRAYAQGHLRTNEHVRVVRETEYIYIEPRQTRVVYVPYYDPRVVYGPWWWSAHPPVYWHYPRYVTGVTFYWGRAYRVSPRFYFSSFYWPQRQVVVINHHHYYRSGGYFGSSRQVAHHKDRRHWQHNPRHRRGVAYHRNISERRFVEQPNGQTVRSVADRPVQARSNQRDWAADRRQNLDISQRDQRGAARASARSEQVSNRSEQGNARVQRTSPSDRSGLAQTSRTESSPSQARLAERSRSQEISGTSASGRASEVRESLSRERNPSLGTREAAGSQRVESATGQSGRGSGTTAIPRQQRENARPTATIPRARANDRSTRSEAASAPSQARQAPPSSRPDAASVSSRLQSSRPADRPTTASASSRPSAPMSSGARQSQPRASAPRTATQQQSSPVASPRSSSSAPRQTPQQSAPAPRRSDSAPARSAPRSTPQWCRGRESNPHSVSRTGF
jgi:hypothetical protein